MDTPRKRTIHWRKGRDAALGVYRSRRSRRIALGVVIALVVFGLLGFFAAPPLIRSQLASRLGAAMDRPVTVERVSLNPFTLRLTVERLHIGEKDAKTSFVDIGKLTANASWSSVFRLAPILDSLTLDQPYVHIQRSAPQRFNFTDIVERFATPADARPSDPARFALSNIAVHGGRVDFDDRVLDATHKLDAIELGVPFIANLPSDADIYVQPLLTMSVDGSPLRLQGQTKPFADSRESVLDLRLDRLELPRYLGFVPVDLPVAVPDGKLSGRVGVHFQMTKTQPRIVVDGRLVVDDLRVTGKDGSALLGLGHGELGLTALEPLTSRYRLGQVALHGFSLRYARLPGGKSNFDALTGPPSPPTPDAKPTDVRIDTLTLDDARIEYADLAAPSPAHLVLDQLQGTLRSFSTVKAPEAQLDVKARLAGGAIATQGKLDLAAQRYAGSLDLKNVSLAALMPLTPPLLAADITGGSVGARGELNFDWHDAVAIRITRADASLDGFKLVPHNGSASPVAWKSLTAKIALVDLATSEARVDQLLLDGLTLDLKRLANGNLDITGIMPPPARPAARAPAANGSAWRWSIAHVGLSDGTVVLHDARAPGRRDGVTLQAKAFGIDGLSDDMRKAVKLDLKGALGKGDFSVSGDVKPQPLDADLRITTTRLDVAPLQSLVTVPLNVRVGSGLLSLDGQVRYTDRGTQSPLLAYRGNATLGRVRVLDKVTDDDFLRWSSLNASGMTLRFGDDVPHVAIGGLALDDFYARVIVNANGRLNLQDVVAHPETQGAVSVTQAQATPAPAVPKEETPAVQAPPADVHIGRISLTKGNLNYTDNFIKPNYTADVTDLTGKIGGFGTDTATMPADITLQGQLDGNAPVDIGGTINPLTPVAFLDITAKAEGIQLANLSPYSGKYAGYPITKGRLNVDVHYLLNERKLTAENHIFIDQLTFGDRIEGPGISHLPVKLAVALLKDTQGHIDVRIPVSGSLDDPQFSLSGLVWRAIGNLIVKAVTSPFRLLASIGGGREDLGYVEFAPGSDVLDAAGQAKLADIVKVLSQKPSISLDIVGRVDPAKDETGLRKVMVDNLVHDEQVKDKGDDTTPPTADEQAKYLERAYRHASFPKPKNFIGLTKSQPPEEMRTLMETNMPVDADALRHLAERRANAVRQWLQGKVDDKRVFVVAPKTDAKGIDDAGKTTRVDFGLH